MLNKSDEKRMQIKVNCSKEELATLNKRVALSNLGSTARYLLECGLNVRGVQDWEERVSRMQLMANLMVLTRLMSDILVRKDLSSEEVEHIKDDAKKINELLDRLVYLFETNLLDKEQETMLQESPVYSWNYFEHVGSQKIN